MSDAETAQKMEKMRTVMTSPADPYNPGGQPQNIPHNTDAATVSMLTGLDGTITQDDKEKYWAIMNKRTLLANLTPTEHRAVTEQGGLIIELGEYPLLETWFRMEMKDLYHYLQASCAQDALLLKSLTRRHNVQEGTYKEETTKKEGVLNRF